MVEEAGVPLGWEGVEGKVLGLGRSKLHVSPVLILVVLERLVSSVQGADVRLGRQLGGDKPLPHDAFGDHGVFFAGGEGKTVSRRQEGRGDTLRVLAFTCLNPVFSGPLTSIPSTNFSDKIKILYSIIISFRNHQPLMCSNSQLLIHVSDYLIKDRLFQ